jgi:hypothetical protein
VCLTGTWSLTTIVESSSATDDDALTEVIINAITGLTGRVPELRVFPVSNNQRTFGIRHLTLDDACADSSSLSDALRHLALDNYLQIVGTVDERTECVCPSHTTQSISAQVAADLPRIVELTLGATVVLAFPVLCVPWIGNQVFSTSTEMMHRGAVGQIVAFATVPWDHGTLLPVVRFTTTANMLGRALVVPRIQVRVGGFSSTYGYCRYVLCTERLLRWCTRLRTRSLSSFSSLIPKLGK